MAPVTAAPEREDSEIDLTPMLDIVFIMLIFFIVSATFIDEFGLAVDTPTARNTKRMDDGRTISVIVGPAASFVVDGRAIAGASLAPYIRQLRAEDPEAGFAVVVAPGSKVKDAARAIDAGRMAGFGVVPITTLQ